MPIPVRLGTPTEPGPESPDIPPIERWRRSEIAWNSANGNSVTLTGDISGWNSGVIVQPGIKGFDAPPYDLQLEEYPVLDGSLYRGVRAQAREVMLPLFLWAPDRPRLLQIKRELLSLFNPRKGQGTLEVTEGDGSSRFLRCFYSGGLEGDEQDAGQFTWCSFGLVLQAPDPYWYGRQVRMSFDRSAPNTVNFYDGRGTRDGELVINPQGFLGMHISSDIPTDSESVIAVSGDEETWPVWVVHNYRGSSLRLENPTSNESFILDYEADLVDTGEAIMVDTRPGRKWVYRGHFRGSQFIRETNLWPYMEARDLWAIPEGRSRARIEIVAIPNAEPSGTIVMQYEPKYLGA